MAIRILSPCNDIPSAARLLLEELDHLLSDDREDQCLKVNVLHFDWAAFFASVRGTVRVFYKSRDVDIAFGGLGVADTLSLDAQLHEKAATLFDDQIYIGAKSFDDDYPRSPEWQSFGSYLFVLPLLLIKKTANLTTLMLNFRANSPVGVQAFYDQATTLLQALSKVADLSYDSHHFMPAEEVPKKNHYFRIVERALSSFDAQMQQKVVIGRRNTLRFDNALDPLVLFIPLLQKLEKSFVFMIDNGLGASFFGASPELLYRRDGFNFATESLAGTRPRGAHALEDEHLKKELFNSLKDQSEHAFVSEHIEAFLREFGARDLITSKLEVMALSYVQHLVRRYEGHIDLHGGDERILRALHPTPAVSGSSRAWALQFIREYEGFDRGLYGGPVGYIHREGAEFAVAIRSALYYEQKLYIYAGSGIVPGSQPEQEWEELTNKQKKIMSIFSSL